MQITLTVKDGATAKDVAAALRFQAGLFEGMEPKTASSRKNTDADEAQETDDEDFGKKPAGKKAAAKFDDDQADEDFTTPAKKTAKAKKLTIDDVNDACKARAKEEGGGKAGRDAVLKLLKKNFKTQSVSDIEETDYARAVEVMNEG